MNAVLRLYNAQTSHAAFTQLWNRVKPWLVAGHALELVVRPERRTTASNARFHAICTDLEVSKFPWFGHPRSDSEWKVLLVSAHAVATKSGSNVIPGIEGEMVNIRESTALMSKARSASLIEYAEAFCIANEVPLRHPEPT